MFRRGQFKINGKHSEEFNAYISERPERLSATRVIELREREGADSIVLDKAYYTNVVRKLKCYSKAPSLDLVQEYEDRIAAWLDCGGYSDFEWFLDPQYIYQAVVTAPPTFTGTRKTGTMIPFEFEVSIRPFKENRTGHVPIVKTTAFSLINTEQYPSKPLLKLYGSGDAVFYINDVGYGLKGLDVELVIDSQIEESYRNLDGALEHQDRVTTFLDFPELVPGKNAIRWTGGIEKMEILPRWCRKV